MAELVDALDLGSSAARCAGSTPVPGTIKISYKRSELEIFMSACGGQQVREAMY